MGFKDYICARADGNLMFRRRVPKEIEHLDSRKEIRTSLKTKDEHVAAIKAREINEKLEAYWGALQRGEDAKTPYERYLAAVDTARSFGFSYRPLDELMAGGLTPDLEARILAAEKVVDQAPAAAEALLGVAPEPDLMLSGLYDEYASHNSLKLAGMSPKQRHIHEGQRRTAIKYLMEVLKGDKALKAIVRKDALDFRAWWVKKVDRDGLTVEAPNKSFSNIKGMLTVIDAALQTDYSAVWTKLNLEGNTKTKAKKGVPYPLDFIQNQLLAPGALDRMNHQARMVLYIMVETGLRPSEIVNLKRQYIVLDHKVPHIVIEERTDRVLKTDSAVRSIPLVGVSLWAAKQCPDGFPAYFDNSDSLSAAVNKFLRENGLRPTPRHSLYSLRHSFQDRILAAKALDRVQADLMGHSMDREEYGEGATLEAKLEVLDGIKFRWAVPDDSTRGAAALS
jgi:integrase